MRKKITLKQETEITIKEGFKKFINEKRAINRSKYTLDYYEKRWGKFETFLDEKEITSTRELSSDIILEYILYIRERNPQITDITINTELRAVRSVCYYFMEKGYTNDFNISLITAKKPMKEVYTAEELEKLVKKPDLKKCEFAEYRNWVIICHLLATGNRSRTIRNIKIKHVDLHNKVIFLDKVKNNTTYEVPISKDYFPILKEYMEMRKGEPDDYLFCTQYGAKFTSDGFRTIMQRYNESRGVNKHGLHLFRHTFAKNWILSNGSSKKLQEALGQNSPAMVDEYLSIFGRELEEDFGKHTPLTAVKNAISKEKIKMK